MSIYQFLIAVRQEGHNLTNDAGETTRCALSPDESVEEELMILVGTQSSSGTLVSSSVGRGREELMNASCSYRTIRMVDNDLKPCYVFDGPPPALKQNVVRTHAPLGRKSRSSPLGLAAQEAVLRTRRREDG